MKRHILKRLCKMLRQLSMVVLCFRFESLTFFLYTGPKSLKSSSFARARSQVQAVLPANAAAAVQPGDAVPRGVQHLGGRQGQLDGYGYYQTYQGMQPPPKTSARGGGVLAGVNHRWHAHEMEHTGSQPGHVHAPRGRGGYRPGGERAPQGYAACEGIDHSIKAASRLLFVVLQMLAVCQRVSSLAMRHSAQSHQLQLVKQQQCVGKVVEPQHCEFVVSCKEEQLLN